MAGSTIPRVAITGIGVVSPFGVGRDCFWRHVRRGCSATRPIVDFDVSSFPCTVAAPVPPVTIQDAIAIEGRAALSPDALTGMEANLRFAGPETMETKIFGRITAWQNWIFQRPNAVGPKGALTAYGTSDRAEFDYGRV